MLRYLTHKLRTQSLNETETYHVKTDDDRDSGTESDDEGAEIEELQKYMESIISLDSSRHRHSGSDPTPRRPRRCQPHTPAHAPAAPAQVTTAGGLPLSPYPTVDDSALPSSDYSDPGHHSSEEELEVIINSARSTEKRKWVPAAAGDENCPVEFRSSPPPNAHKPSKCLRQAARGIPSHELLCSTAASPRKRHRRTPTGHAVQRPCLDFEKMQQINRVRLL